MCGPPPPTERANLSGERPSLVKERLAPDVRSSSPSVCGPAAPRRGMHLRRKRLPVAAENRTGMDPSLRDTTLNSIARWKRRLEGAGDVALIPREAEQLRGLAMSHGVAPLAEHLARIAAT